MAVGVPRPVDSTIVAERLGVAVAALLRRAELARDQVFGALDVGLQAERLGPDPAPPGTVIQRAAVLVGMLMDHEPADGDDVASWDERGKQLVKLHEALTRVRMSTPAGAPALFSELRQALVQAELQVDRELAWRTQMVAAARDGRAIDAMPFTLRALWSSDQHRVGRRTRGTKPTKRAAAAVARQYGLTTRHMALLESSLRIDIEPWTTAVLPWSEEQKLYLPPLEGELPDHITDDDVLGTWRKAFEEPATAKEE